MPKLYLQYQEKEHSIEFDIGQTIREILDTTEFRVRTGCRGNGMCGLCRVRIIEGKANEVLPNERLNLGDEQLEKGIRLACQATPAQDLRVILLDPAPKSNWRSLSDYQYKTFDINKNKTFAPHYQFNGTCQLGAAVDLGTTHISLSVWDMANRHRLCGRWGLNRQHTFGSDVVSRLMAACVSRDQIDTISSLVRESIADALNDIHSREFINISNINKVVIVGNTAMVSLLAVKNYDLLLKPASWSSCIDCQPEDVRSHRDCWGIHKDSVVDIVQPVAGFVGSDLLAGVLSTHLTKSPECSLLVDFGTNSEIALWDGSYLWVTSAAGGPAFEGSGISCGMPAETGAIYSINPDGEKYNYKTISDSTPKGLCGTGLIDLVACLVDGGTINSKGNFTQNGTADKIAILEKHLNLYFSKHDIDVFQRAKAAVATGISILMKNAGVTFGDLKRICVCGVFGRFLNIRSAQRIGLLPEVPESSITLSGNTALAGCEHLLLEKSAALELEQVRKTIKFVNIADSPDFEESFLENLFLKPMKGAVYE